MENYMPVFNIVIEYDDETGMIRNSFVANPAVGIEKLAFNAQEKTRMVFADESRKNCFMSVSILADTPILRRTQDGREFYVVFEKETIRKIVNKLVMEGKQNEVSLYHEDSKVLENVFLVEQFMVEKGRVESPKFDVPDGSLISTYWVKDDEMYNQLLSDPNFNGFSIEISANLEAQFEAHFSDEVIANKIKEIVFREDLSDEDKEKIIKELIK